MNEYGCVLIKLYLPKQVVDSIGSQGWVCYSAPASGSLRSLASVCYALTEFSGNWSSQRCLLGEKWQFRIYLGTRDLYPLVYSGHFAASLQKLCGFLHCVALARLLLSFCSGIFCFSLLYFSSWEAIDLGAYLLLCYLNDFFLNS